MVNISTKQQKITIKRCSICNSPVEVVSCTTDFENGQAYPVTTTQYSCSNKECRDKTQKELATLKQQAKKRLEHKEEQIRKRREKSTVQK